MWHQFTARGFVRFFLGRFNRGHRMAKPSNRAAGRRAPFVEELGERLAPASLTYIGGNGEPWNVDGNWEDSSDPNVHRQPTAADNAFIPVGKDVVVARGTSVAANVTVTGFLTVLGTLNATNVRVYSGPAIARATVTVAGTMSLTETLVPFYLDNFRVPSRQAATRSHLYSSHAVMEMSRA